MAFTPSIAQRLYLQALGAARQAGVRYDPVAFAQSLYARRGNLTNSFLDFLNTARSAGRAQQAGFNMRGLGTQALRTRQHPIDPTIPAGGDRFRYRVVIFDQQGVGQSAFSTVINVDSRTPMSEDDIINLAIQTAQVQHGTLNESPRARQTQAPQVWAAAIIAAGRAY